MEQRRSTRLIARVGAGTDWFPATVSEVVSHTDGQFVAVTIARRAVGRGSVLLREFDCRNRDACLDELRSWLRHLAEMWEAGDARGIEWAERIARRVVDGIDDA
jgi:hypothetical protein